MKKVNIPKGALELKVSIIDKDKLSEKISNAVGQNFNLMIDYDGFLKTDVNSYLIDNECCGVKESEMNFLFQDENANCVSANCFREVPFRRKKEEKIIDGQKATTISIFPSHYFDIDFDFLEDCIVEEIPLCLFMGSRFNYNDRIKSNLHNILSDVFFDKKEYITESVEVDDWK